MHSSNRLSWEVYIFILCNALTSRSRHLVSRTVDCIPVVFCRSSGLRNSKPLRKPSVEMVGSLKTHASFRGSTKHVYLSLIGRPLDLLPLSRYDVLHLIRFAVPPYQRHHSLQVDRYADRASRPTIRATGLYSPMLHTQLDLPLFGAPTPMVQL